ncbi:MAG: hypothetical protein HY308_11260 [Gammaproteobacteria bacterium]|nr:hypothetical protein [Gammaproteobacteria bacterium]
MLPVKIVSTGCYIPSVKVPSTDFDEKFDLEPGTVEKKTGIRTRYYGNEVEISPYMGGKAVKAALDRAQLTLDDVDALISVSGGPAQGLPCTASLILAELDEAPRHLAVFDIDATCLSFLVGFDTMAHLIAAGRYRRVVLVAAENGSSHLNPHEWESAALIGDAAVAVVIERDTEHSNTATQQHSKASQFCAGSFMIAPKGRDYARVRIGGSIYGPRSPRTPTPEDSFFTIQGRHMMRLIGQITPGFYERFLTANNQQPADIDLFLTHQLSEPLIQLIGRQLDWPEERHFVHLRDYGNTIAASIPLGLHFAIEQGRLKRGDFFTMEGPKLFHLAAQHMPGFYERFLTENEQRLSDIDLFMFHQASGPAVKLMSRRLGWPKERHFVYLRDYGNTVAASIPLGLHFAIEQGRLTRGHKVLLYGQGAGLALGIVTFVY